MSGSAENIPPATPSSPLVKISRRQFAEFLGSGVLMLIAASDASAVRPGNTQAAAYVSDRLHVGVNGIITVMTGKVDIGQGSRTELSMVAAEELKVDLKAIRLIMGDTELCPDDGHTGSSMTTPRTVPRIRAACAAARQVLIEMAAKRWNCQAGLLKAANGSVVHAAKGLSISYSELAGIEGTGTAMSEAIENESALTPAADWTIMGRPVGRLTGTDIVLGSQVFPSDVRRPGMLYGKVLNPPAYGARLTSIDLDKARKMENVTVIREGDFVGVAAPTSYLAEQALERLAVSARYETVSQASSDDLFEYIREHVVDEHKQQGKVVQKKGQLKPALEEAALIRSESYQLAPIQHAPLEPRAAVAEWKDGKVTVWTGTSSPFPVRQTIADKLGIPAKLVRVIVPDTGGHFCGKHTGEAAIQAARLARTAGRPVHICWSREEEFTWAYFRKAGIIDVQASIDALGRITTWDWTTWHCGDSAITVPYTIPNIFVQSKSCRTPLRDGSYRAVAAPANLFARESFMDELAHAASVDPLEFRLRHLSDERLRTVLEATAHRFGWNEENRKRSESRGFGLACGTDKGAYVATCAEVEVDRTGEEIRILRVCEAFECGSIINPANLRLQVEGCIVMGMGGALWEEIRFDNGRILNAGFDRYRVPRFRDVPDLDIVLVDRPDLPSTGAGETPIITIAPAIANALFAATGKRIRSMPIQTEFWKEGQRG